MSGRIGERAVRKMIGDLFQNLEMGYVHTRGKYAATDSARVNLLRSEIRKSFGPEAEVKGVYVLPYTYGASSVIEDDRNLDLSSVWRLYRHLIYWIVEFKDERGNKDINSHSPNDWPSFEYFTFKIDTFLELFDRNMQLQIPLGQGHHNLLRTSVPIYDHNVPDVGLFHFGVFELETRIKTVIYCPTPEPEEMFL